MAEKTERKPRKPRDPNLPKQSRPLFIVGYAVDDSGNKVPFKKENFKVVVASRNAADALLAMEKNPGSFYITLTKE